MKKSLASVFLAVVLLLLGTSVASANGTGWYSIWAGQNMLAGIFQVVPYGDNAIKIQIIPVQGWKLTESHIEVVTDPTLFPINNGGNPAPGQFRWAQKSAPSTVPHEYVIPYADIPSVSGATVYIAVHVVVVKTDIYGNIIQDETGWGGPCDTDWNPSLPLPTGFWKIGASRWGYYFSFVLP